MNLSLNQLFAVIGMLKDNFSQHFILEYVERCLKWNIDHEKKTKKK